MAAVVETQRDARLRAMLPACFAAVLASPKGDCVRQLRGYLDAVEALGLVGDLESLQAISSRTHVRLEALTRGIEDLLKHLRVAASSTIRTVNQSPRVN